jgi:hypothetical protein
VRATFRETVDETRMTELALNGRNPLQFGARGRAAAERREAANERRERGLTPGEGAGTAKTVSLRRVRAFLRTRAA